MLLQLRRGGHRCPAARSVSGSQWRATTDFPADENPDESHPRFVLDWRQHLDDEVSTIFEKLGGVTR